MVTQPLLDYIQQARAAGQTDEQITQALTQQGWQQPYIQAALGEDQGSPPPQPPQSQTVQGSLSQPGQIPPASSPTSVVSKKPLSPYWILTGVLLYIAGYILYLIANRRIGHSNKIGHIGFVITLFTSFLFGGFGLGQIVLLLQLVFTTILFFDHKEALSRYQGAT